MPAFYIAPESGIPYTIVSPTGARAVLNDPTDPDFVGYLDGEEAITGIDSPEIRDSYADLADNDGGMAGTNFYSRRPIVMNGKVFPTSAADRNTKLGKLMAATDARYADGTLTWTPTGGEPVFVKFRRQLPFRAKGGFNKEFQIGLVCADPRIYTVRSFTRFIETNGNSASRDFRRFTWSSGSNTSVVNRPFYLPAGSYKVSVPVRCSQSGRLVQLWESDTLGAGTSAVANGTWQLVTREFTKPSDAQSSYTVYLDNALTSGNYLEVGDPIFECLSGAVMPDNMGFASAHAAQTGYTASWQTSSPPNNLHTSHPGNAPSMPRTRLLGPGSNVSSALDLIHYVNLQPFSAYNGSAAVCIDWGWRTITNPSGGASQYGDIGPSTWGAILPDTGHASYINATAGATGATRMDMTWRGVWL